MRLAEIRVTKRVRKDLGDIDSLANSIADIGLLQPLAVRPNGELVAGVRRLEACKQLGLAEVPVHIVKDLHDALGLLRAERDENVQRKDFTPEEAVNMGAALEPLERAEAAIKMLAGRPSGKLPDGAINKQESSTTKPAEQSRDKVAAAVGMSGRTYEKAKKVVEAAQAEPEKYAALLSEMNNSGRVNGVFKKLETARQAEQITSGPPPLPTGPFRVIAADPPWQYQGRAEDASHRVANPYPSMSIDEIKALGSQVRQMAHDDAILWLWTTNAHMRQAYEVLDAWGFESKTILTWVKDRMGTGDWLRGKTEHCLLAVRGKPALSLTNQTTVLTAPNKGHSTKPDAFYEMVEALCPAPVNGRVEMFARKPRLGWVVWGSEVNDHAS